ncbi:MAG: hypothetical protein A2086_05420 [Spirochaetes bacterium GWD1_27_9]|nr:MAG: hypothetical protein A2Z98_15875 [Spirochaetes bacterium GWB1_27_13]OHD26133.1 MAG: hypothetical protein A2Y34_07165 [Spirochaetes bacterium GWC1_27_15]OHD31817.1 MAG: hypothetical protein A2086_05420 [Spirochaetes bacterium GWD1_27_9]
MKLQKSLNSGFVELIFGPRWTYIAAVRNFLQKFLFVTLEDVKSADLISMAASELLENAIKYASEEGTKISVKHFKEDDTLDLAVENYSFSDNIKILKEEIEKVNIGSPEEMYLFKMQEAALRTDGGSQLGFARIRYETCANIKLDATSDLVKIVVSFDLTKIRGRK